MRLTILLASLLWIVTIGCGGGGPTPDTPASLTPEQEQEILKQVHGASQQEAGQQNPNQ